MYQQLTEPPPEHIAFLEAHDYWFGEHLERPRFGFPHILGSMQILPYLLERRQIASGRGKFHFVNDRSEELAKYLIARFAQEAERRGLQPLFLIIEHHSFLPALEQGINYNAPILEFLESRGLPHVDAGTYMVESGIANYLDIAAPMGHFNRRGNQLIAEALAKHPLLQR